MTEEIRLQPDDGWRFFTDQVMGGLSSGGIVLGQEDGASFVRMSGHVSTANNGGFIQMRLALTAALPADLSAVRIVARGNGQRYFVHLRTTRCTLPWQYYRAGFDVSDSWGSIHLPLQGFAPSGRPLPAIPTAQSLSSVAIVAAGRDHQAHIDLREIAFC